MTDFVRARIAAELRLQLAAIAADRKCAVDDLSARVHRDTENSLLSAYRKGREDALQALERPTLPTGVSGVREAWEEDAATPVVQLPPWRARR